ncbi:MULTISPECIES: adenosylcobinamide-GDP ribazoletransferase [Streptomyces]|uniref:adenosylcobinamide-GDP ribazoletransferase n=1 Tax=Streptomyces TaxID=1883 RepID=UPI0011086FEB|nr:MULTISPECIES: adenosylcobinamide-GDP ribazoletransferase [Streptomyces]
MTASSKPRPKDWHPLADSDPVPGDPEEIRAEVKHMVNMAKSLRAQATDLTRIRDDNELKGKYAGKLREESGDLEKHLREVASRYERVHGFLSSWASDLEDCQTDADKILANAKREQEEIDAAKKKAESSESSADSSQKTPGEDPLKHYRTQLAKIEGHRDERAGHYAKAIGNEIKDIIKDSWWEGVVDYVKIAIDVLSWTATIIGLVALFITPVGWVAMVATVATALVMGGHVLLAITGDGSWMDVATDAFSLVTMGMGAKALKGLKTVQTVMRKASAKEAGKAARAAKGAENNNKINNAIRNADRQARKRTTSKKKRRGAERALQAAQKQKNAARNEARAAERSRDLPNSNRRELAASGGDKEFARSYKDIQHMRASHPNSPEVLKAGQNAEVYRDRFRTAFGAGLTADLADKGLGTSDIWPDKPYVEGYNETKEKFTVQRGSGW